MINKKFSDIFSKKEDRQKNVNRVDRTQFDESYFTCKLAYHPYKLSLIKVNATIVVGPEADTPLMIKCRWFIKKNNQCSQIQGVNSSCYQPCVDDVGHSIFVQIQPIIQGKVYTGGQITKETNALELGATLQTQFTQLKNTLYRNSQSLSFAIKIEQMKISSLDSGQEYQLPQEAMFLIRKKQEYDFDLEIAMKNQKFKTYYWITKKYPQIEFIRKSYNSLIIHFNEEESMRVAFTENTDRQIYALLIKTLVANSSIDDAPKQQIKFQLQNIPDNIDAKKEEKEPSVAQNRENSQSEQKKSAKQKYQEISNISSQPQKIESAKEQQICSIENIQQKGSDAYGQISPQAKTKNISSQNTLQNPNSSFLQTNINKLTKQLASVKQEHSNLIKKYNIDKQIRIKSQKQFKKLSNRQQEYHKIATENKQLQVKMQKTEDMNRFYKNQISLLKKQLKKNQSQTKILSQEQGILKQQLKSQQNTKQTSKQQKYSKTIGEMELEKKGQKIDELLEMNDNLKNQVERLQNVLIATHKKVESLNLQKMYNKSNHTKSQQFIQHGGKIDTESYKINEILIKKDQIISDLQFKVANLQNIFKYKSGDAGNQLFALQKIINSMTENITQKQEQIQSLKKINKQLMNKIKMVNQ